jgi:uncharacterized protein
MAEPLDPVASRQPDTATSSSTTIDTAAPRLRLLVLQPTPFCNIDCSYCYLPNRKSAARMSLDTLDLACQRVFESPFLDRQLEVAWHGGEPLTVPLAWYDEASALMALRCPAELKLKHRFQTNGLLVNDDWARFFARFEAKVGLSIDGPEDIHDAGRRTRRGRGTHAKAMRAARLLQDRGVGFHVITVLTEHTLDEPDRLFDFYVENGITEVGFNIEEIEGAHRISSLSGDSIEPRYRKFIRRFFERVWNAPSLLKVRELESTIGLILSDVPATDEQNLSFAVVSIGHDGAISTFSPELLGTHHPRFSSFEFGHVTRHTLSDVTQAPLFRAASTEIRRGVEACERNCRYFRWCGGGAPANKLFETGRFDTTETMHCRLTRQVMLDEVVAGLEARSRKQEIQSERPDARILLMPVPFVELRE